MVRSELREGLNRFDVKRELRPAIYFDQFARYRFASEGRDGERFARIFESRGELLFLSVNLFASG